MNCLTNLCQVLSPIDILLEDHRFNPARRSAVHIEVTPGSLVKEGEIMFAKAIAVVAEIQKSYSAIEGESH